LTPASFEKLLDDIATGKSVKPGPLNGRQLSAPEGELTSLTDKALYSKDRIFKRMEAPPPPPPALVPVVASAAAVAATAAPDAPAKKVVAKKPVAKKAAKTPAKKKR